MRLCDVQCVYVCVCSVFVVMSISVLCNNVCTYTLLTMCTVVACVDRQACMLWIHSMTCECTHLDT